MAAVFQLDVLAASVPFFQGKCVSAVIPVTDGEYGVLAGHSNAVGAVCAGELRFETEDASTAGRRWRRGCSRSTGTGCFCCWTRRSGRRIST